jgi:hypothetical protein
MQRLLTPSLLILDEVHNAAPASNSLRYAIDSGLTRSLRDLAPRFQHRLFLSATPHNGHSNSFTALLELLDPARFTRGVPFDPADLETVLVRRLKDDLRIALNEAFPERIVESLRIPKGFLPPDAPELELSRLLQRYRKQREARLLAEGASKRAINADRLVTPTCRSACSVRWRPSPAPWRCISAAPHLTLQSSSRNCCGVSPASRAIAPIVMALIGSWRGITRRRSPLLRIRCPDSRTTR